MHSLVENYGDCGMDEEIEAGESGGGDVGAGKAGGDLGGGEEGGVGGGGVF